VKAKPCTTCLGRGASRRGAPCLMCAGTGRASGRGLDSRTAEARATWLLSAEGQQAAREAAEARAVVEARDAADQRHALDLVAEVFELDAHPAARAWALARLSTALQLVGSDAGAVLALEACHEAMAEAEQLAAATGPGSSSPESHSVGTRPDVWGKGAHGATAASRGAPATSTTPRTSATRPNAHRAASGPSARGSE